MSTFSADAFLNTETSDALSTSSLPVPEGEYPAAVKEIKARTTASGKSILDVTWAIDSPEAAAATGVTTPTVRQSIFLDLTDSGGLDSAPGKNPQLGKLREALGQNQKGKPWKPGMLIGGVALVTIKHRQVEDATFADVKGTAKL